MALLDHALDPCSGLRHLTITTAAKVRAAEFWAFLRQMGIPTASLGALDADATRARSDDGDEPASSQLFSRCRKMIDVHRRHLRGKMRDAGQEIGQPLITGCGKRALLCTSGPLARRVHWSKGA
jgi:hypothetical protein